MERFRVERSKLLPDGWVVTDFENGIVCVFENHRYNDTQQFTILEDIETPDVHALARMGRELGDWLRENHYEKCF